jgi:myosin heavy subunit
VTSLSSTYSVSRGPSALDLYSFKGGELENLRTQVKQLQHELDEAHKVKVLELESVKAEMFRELESLESQHHSELLSLQEQHQQEIAVHQAVSREHEDAFNHARQDMYELMKANADAIASLQSSQEEANATQSVLSQLRIQFGAMEVRSRELASSRDALHAQLEKQSVELKSLQQQFGDVKPSAELLDIECKTLRDQVLALSRAKEAAERSRDKAIEAAATAEFALGSLQETSRREISALKGALEQAESFAASAAESERGVTALKRELELLRSASVSESTYQSMLHESRTSVDAANESLRAERAARAAAQNKLAEVPAMIQKEVSAIEAKMRAAASQSAAQMQRDLAIAKADAAALSGSFETRVANEVRLRMSEMQLDQNQNRSEEMQVRAQSFFF